MLLQQLREYSERLDLPPTLYDSVPVRYIIDLRPDGVPEGISDTADATSPATRRGVRRLAPQVKRASAIKPLLLADNAEYTLGLAREGSKPERVEEAHAAYLDLIERCCAATENAPIAAVAAFMSRIPDLALPEDFDRSGLITFRVDGAFVIDERSVQGFWAAENAPDNSILMQCLICGQLRPVLERLQANIKGGLIPGGQTSGTAIISANADAFESYGLKASLTAPTCSDCGERFTKALNHLLGDEESRIRFGDDSVMTFWTREQETDWNPFALLNEASPEDVRTLLQSLHTGRRATLDANRFYAVSLSAAGGRAVVRDWIDVTLPEAQDALAKWFARQAILDAATGTMRHFGLRALGGATVRDMRDISPPTARALLRCALTGGPLPQSLLAAAVRRTQAERRVTAAHASLIKIVIVSATDYAGEEDDMTALQQEHPSPGYQCGRLMAVLESVQRAALPGVKAGIVDRYFGSASSSPASVFSRLVRGAQPHLGVLGRDKPAVQRALQGRLEQVLDQLPSFPRVLTLQEQGLFALGYYHQRADDRARMRAAADRKRAGTASAEDLTESEMDDEVGD